ncbi:hypothetical protein [Mycoplana ramosa]|uniref:Uncharacterized protein n=1 Tax=Mycoplana ramosa TaxID=40837 RepID=A0ABW3Z135_MYCRA
MNKPFKLRPLTCLLAVFLMALPPVAFGQPLGAFTVNDRSDPFTDLPGVKTPEEAARKDEMICSQSYDETEPRRWGEFRQPVYTCTQNGRTFTSRNPPPSRERALRGIGW